MKLTTRVCILYFVCFVAPPESVEGFTGAYRAVTVNHGGKRRLATMMVDSKIEGISERNAKLLAQAERLRAEGLCFTLFCLSFYYFALLFNFSSHALIANFCKLHSQCFFTQTCWICSTGVGNGTKIASGRIYLRNFPIVRHR